MSCGLAMNINHCRNKEQNSRRDLHCAKKNQFVQNNEIGLLAFMDKNQATKKFMDPIKLNEKENKLQAKKHEPDSTGYSF